MKDNKDFAKRNVVCRYDFFECLAEELTRLREARGLTKSELAKRARVTTQLVSNYETNHTILSLNRLLMVANALGVNLSELMEAVEFMQDYRATEGR